MAEGSPPPEPNWATRHYRAVLAQLGHGPVMIGLSAAAVVIGVGAVVHVATRPHQHIQANRPPQPSSASLPAYRPQPSSASSLPACSSSTATGCDSSRLPVGTRGSSACQGRGPGTITASPIAVSDLAYVQPMGLMIGGHVTPIDHGYFYIKGAVAHPPQQAAVYAPLGGNVSSVTRTVRRGDPASKQATFDDYAITIEATCTFRVRFSNMVRFAGALGDNVGQMGENENKTPNYAVKAGELIGYTGLPTAFGIDVWVENDDVTLTGFVDPAQYTAAEVWKTHMADLFDHTAEPLKSQLLALDERDATPRWGRIDYDIDGKLVGNWFRAGTGGYGGNQFGRGGNYWSGHLSVVYDGNDPRQIDISFGDYQGQPQQFAVVGNTPDPATVDQSSGLIKFELGQIERSSGDTGKPWDGQQYVPHVTTRAGPVAGTVLMQLTGQRQLKMEIFAGTTASHVAGFDAAAELFER